MARIHLDRLRKKYGWTGQKYRDLMTRILAQNSETIQTSLANHSKANYEAARKRMKRGSRLVVADVWAVVPSEAVTVRKAAERGRLLTDQLRKRMKSDLTDSLVEFSGKTGEPTFFTRRGRRAGRINPKLVKDFEQRVSQTFANYSSNVGSPYAVPRNIHTIAVTEVRAAANEVKARYAERMLELNPGLVIKKTWIHNRSLSKEPRPHHMAIDGQVRLFEQMFRLGNGVLLRYPHDPDAPIEETASCHCDQDIRLEREVEEI